VTRLDLQQGGPAPGSGIGLGQVYAELCAIRRQNSAILKALGVLIRDMNRGRAELIEEGRAMRQAADVLLEASRTLSEALSKAL
jgi:hypothetical protein